MANNTPRSTKGPGTSDDRLDAVVAAARRAREERERGYRERALKLYPWVCGPCARTLTYANPRFEVAADVLGVSPVGRAEQLLCLYCHDNEHRRLEDHLAADGRSVADKPKPESTHKAFGALADLLKGRS